MHFRHTLELRPLSNDLVLRWIDSEWIPPRNHSLTKDEVNKTKSTLRRAMLATPPLLIRRTGEAVTCLDASMEIKQMNAELDSVFPGRPKNAGALLENVEQTDEGRQLMANILRNTYWGPWVENWIDWDLKSGQARRTNTVVAMNRHKFNATVTRQHLGSVEQIAQLRTRVEASGPEVWRAFGSQIDKLAKNLPDDERSPLPPVSDVRYSEVVEAQTELATLKPIWSKRVVTIVLTPTNSPSETNREIREFRFHWKKQ